MRRLVPTSGYRTNVPDCPPCPRLRSRRRSEPTAATPEGRLAAQQACELVPRDAERPRGCALVAALAFEDHLRIATLGFLERQAGRQRDAVRLGGHDGD